MRVLRLVGPDDDGTSVLLETDSGEVFSLPVDDRLRAASRADRAHLGQLDAALSGPLRPRDIQIRVRGGESAQELAEQSGMPVERVMRFAYPVLAERTRVADEARRARARRAGDGHLVPFGELIDARLAAHEIVPETISWDAFRRPDGGWTVTADVAHGDDQVQAKFSFSLSNRTVSALNDVAADLLSGRPIAALTPVEPDAQSVAFGRLSAVPDHDPGQPARRRRAFTHPLPISVDDELFDQDAFGSDDFSAADFGPVDLGPVDLGSADLGSVDFGPVDLGSLDVGSINPASVDSPTLDFPSADSASAEVAADLVPQATSEPDLQHWDLTPGDTVSGAEQPVAAEPLASEPPSATSAPTGVSRRGGRHGDKPRMPSWDDILLGVRRRPE